jgi:hypothetical protein
MKTVLFFNHKVEKCGVYQYGRRVYDILVKTQEIEYIYKEIDGYSEYVQTLSSFTSVDVIIYNYHDSTMGWLNGSTIQKKVKNIGISHESQEYMFDIKINIDPTIPETPLERYTIPRPIYENIEEIVATPIAESTRKEFIEKYQDANLPIIGSFGFGFEDKQFWRLIEMINNQYDEAIIKFLIPMAHFGGSMAAINEMVQGCYSVPRKPGIQLMITHEFFTNTELLQFLHSNTMNIFLYKLCNDRSISSTIDYALSARKPLGISDSHMFRHIYSDAICVYKRGIPDILQDSLETCRPFLEKYSNENMRAKFREIVFSAEI